MKKINENTRTTMVYTSDLNKRPKTQQSNQMVHSMVVPKRDNQGEFDNYMDFNNEQSLKEKLQQKRQTLKSQQQNSRYEKKHRGTFAWDFEPASKPTTVRQSRTRNFRNQDNDFEIKSQNVNKLFQN